jgi:hypothetical protein
MNTTAIPQENNCRNDNFDDFSEISIGGLLPEFAGHEAVLGFECFAEGGFGFITDLSGYIGDAAPLPPSLD